MMLGVIACGGCLEWEPSGDASSSQPEAPALHALTPSFLPDVDSFDPRDASGRCRIACDRYVECFGPQVDRAACESNCHGQAWVTDSGDLACFVWSACTELWLCYE